MKYFILLIPRIGGLGGAQIYAQNKLNFMDANGWKTLLFYSYDDDLHLNDLKARGVKIQELSYSTYLYPVNKIKKIVNTIKKELHDVDECIIESTCMQQALWGEIIARELRAKHIVYLLQESNVIPDKQWLSFFNFKYERRELVSINETSLQKMFYPYRDIPYDKSYMIEAFSSNVVQVYDSKYVDIIKSMAGDYVIGFLSRLDKPFVKPCILQFINYANLHIDRNFIFLLIGGAPDMGYHEKYIKGLFKNVKNVKVVMTGTLYPIPRALLELCDVFLSSAGSAMVTESEGIPTIVFDSNDFQPIGLYNITTKHTTFREEDPIISLEELLDSVLIKCNYIKTIKNKKDLSIDFSSHLIFFNESERTKKYYDVSNMEIKNIGDMKLAILLRLFGTGLFNKVAFLKRKIYE